MQCLLLLVLGREDQKISCFHPNIHLTRRTNTCCCLILWTPAFLGVTVEESSKPLFHFTLYTWRLKNMGFQHQRTGEWGDQKHPCAPRECQHLDTAPQRPWKPVEKQQHQLERPKAGSGQYSHASAFRSPSSHSKTLEMIGPERWSKKIQSFGLDVNLKNETWAELQ